MSNLKGSQMKSAVEKILGALGKLADFQNADEFHCRIENKPFMPLVIERHGERVMVTHYYTQNGDMIPDPDMEFEIIGEDWFPVAIQHSDGRYFWASMYENGKKLVNQLQLRDQLAFSNIWARNLIGQGYSNR